MRGGINNNNNNKEKRFNSIRSSVIGTYQKIFSEYSQLSSQLGSLSETFSDKNLRHLHNEAGGGMEDALEAIVYYLNIVATTFLLLPQ